MKKLLTIAIASIAVAAAAGTYSPSIGVTSISLSQKNNVIPVQFNSLATSGNVTAGELVCTNNIPLTSHLYVYDSANGYTAWELQESGWVGLNVASTKADDITYSGNASNKVLSAGSAIWLSFPAAQDPAINVSFYGKVATSTNTTIAAGTESAPVSTLVCNPTGAVISSADLKTKLAEFRAAKDKIIPLNAEFGGYYSYSAKDSIWKKVTGATASETEELPNIPVNGGFWYVRAKGNTTDGSIIW